VLRHSSVLVLQHTTKGFLQRNRYVRVRGAALAIQRWARSRARYKNWRRLRVGACQQLAV
jgi:hypothetical protein